MSAANVSTVLFLDRMVLAVNGFMILSVQRLFQRPAGPYATHNLELATGFPLQLRTCNLELILSGERRTVQRRTSSFALSDPLAATPNPGHPYNLHHANILHNTKSFLLSVLSPRSGRCILARSLPALRPGMFFPALRPPMHSGALRLVPLFPTTNL